MNTSTTHSAFLASAALILSALLISTTVAPAHTSTHQSLLYAELVPGEVMHQGGELLVNFLGKTIEESSPWDVTPFLEAPKTFPGFGSAELEVNGDIPPIVTPQRPARFRFKITYDPENLPFYLQRFRVGLRDRDHPGMIKYTNFYLYFTPYGTVEILNLEVLPDPLTLGIARLLARDWLSPANGPRDRKTIPREAIPQSDLTLEELQDENVPKQFLLIPGLAYQIPFRAPAPKKLASRKAANFTYSGTVTGTVVTEVDLAGRPHDDLLPLAGLQVDLEAAGTGLFGGTTGTVITTTTTDSNGEFEFTLNNYGHDDSTLGLFVTIRAENQDGTIRVRKRLGAAVRNESVSKDSPLVVNSGNFGTLPFGQIETDNHLLKGQLLHWALRAKNFAAGELASSFSFTAGRRLDIMIGATEPFGCSSPGLFLPGGLKVAFALILSAFADPTGPGVLSGLTAVGALLSLSDKDTIYICSTDGTEVNDGTLSHEFGHYLMYHLQNRWWPSFTKAGPYNHGSSYNNPFVELSLTEGWANGFGRIMETVNRHEKQDPTTPELDVTGLQRERLVAVDVFTNGDLAQGFARSFVEDGGVVNADVQTVTHGFVSEYLIGHLIYDLWDGPNNLLLDGNVLEPTFGDAEFNDSGTDNVELSLLEIATPLLNNRPTGTSLSGAIGVLGAPTLLKSIPEYHAALLDTLTSNNRKGRLTRLFDRNLIHNVDESLADEQLDRHHLNSDSLLFNTEITTPNFKRLGVDLDMQSITDPAFRVPSALGIPPITISDFTTQGDFDVSIHRLVGGNDDYNLFVDPARSNETNFLSDDLTVQNGATFYIHRDDQREFQDLTNAFGLPLTGLMPAPGHDVIELIGEMTFRVRNGGRLVVGDPGGDHTATLHVRDGCTLVIGNGGTLRINQGSNLIIHKGANLVYRNGATIKLMNAESAELDIRGNWLIENGADFTFEGPGHIRTDLDSQVTALVTGEEERAANITIVEPDGSGGFQPVDPIENASASITLRGSITPGKLEDTLIIVADDTYLRPPETDGFEITLDDGIAELGKDSSIDMAWGTCSLVDLTIRSSATAGGPHRGVFIHGRDANIDNVCVSGGIDGITMYQHFDLAAILPKPPATGWQSHLTVKNSQFLSNEIGVHTVGGSSTITATLFESNGTGWHSELPRGISRVDAGTGRANGGTAYTFKGDGEIAMVNFCQTLIEDHVGGAAISASGGVRVSAQHCTINDNHIGFSIGDDCLLDLSDGSFNDCEDNEITMSFDAAQPPLLTNGHNLFGPALAPPLGIVMSGSLTDPCGVIDASANRWNLLAAGAPISPVSGLQYDLEHVSDPLCIFTVVDPTPLAVFSPPVPAVCKRLLGTVLPLPDLDIDFDGVSDLLEIYQGRDPARRDSKPAISTLTTPGQFGLTFPEAYNSYRLIGLPEWSTDMVNWRTDGFRRSRVLSGPTEARHWLNTATLDPALIAERRKVFVRLRVRVRGNSK